MGSGITREEITKALSYFAAKQPDADEGWRSSHIVDFALEMVRRHNEECARIADGMIELRKGIAKAIRKAKP